VASSGTGNPWTDDSTLPGWYAAFTNDSTGLTPFTAYNAVSGGSGVSATLYSLGTTGSSERALGGVGVTATKNLLAWRLVNGSTDVITNIILTYDGEEWRCGTP